MIRLASEQDLPAIAAIYEAILDHEDATGLHYTGWQRVLSHAGHRQGHFSGGYAVRRHRRGRYGLGQHEL